MATKRFRRWCWLFAAGGILILGALAIGTGLGAHATPSGFPPGTDFVSFWTAAHLALTGPAASVWDPVRHAAAEWALPQTVPRPRVGYFAFFYPPTFLLVLLPLGALPYIPALLVWLGATTLAYAAAVHRLLGRARGALLPLLAFPAVALNAANGQNGALTAALFGAGALWLETRPVLAGACLGVLGIKPQLAILIAPTLLAARRWRGLIGFAASSLVLVLASWLVFGAPAWISFWQHGADATEALQAGTIGNYKMVSVFAALRLLGADLSLAWAGQISAALLATACLLRLAYARPGAPLELAACVLATFLTAPFVLDYDLTVMALPLAVAAGHDLAARYTWRMAALFALPIFARPVAYLGVAPTPFLAAAVLAAVWRAAMPVAATRRPRPAELSPAPHRT